MERLQQNILKFETSHLHIPSMFWHRFVPQLYLISKVVTILCYVVAQIRHFTRTTGIEGLVVCSHWTGIHLNPPLVSLTPGVPGSQIPRQLSVLHPKMPWSEDRGSIKTYLSTQIQHMILDFKLFRVFFQPAFSPLGTSNTCSSRRLWP